MCTHQGLRSLIIKTKKGTLYSFIRLQITFYDYNSINLSKYKINFTNVRQMNSNYISMNWIMFTKRKLSAKRNTKIWNWRKYELQMTIKLKINFLKINLIKRPRCYIHWNSNLYISFKESVFQTRMPLIFILQTISQ